MDDELRPCPFCGDKAKIIFDKYGRLGILFNVMCDGECGTFFDCREKTEDEAIKAWNTRAGEIKTACARCADKDDEIMRLDSLLDAANFELSELRAKQLEPLDEDEVFYFLMDNENYEDGHVTLSKKLCAKFGTRKREIDREKLTEIIEGFDSVLYETGDYEEVYGIPHYNYEELINAIINGDIYKN